LDFLGGVYVTFLVDATSRSSPVCVGLRVRRNHSLNAILSGIFVDPAGPDMGFQNPVGQPGKPYVSQYVSDPRDGISLEGAAIRGLDALLVERDAPEPWYWLAGRVEMLGVARALMARVPNRGFENVNRPSLAESIHNQFNPAGFRKNLATCLGDLRLYAWRDQIYFPRDAYDSYAWFEQTYVSGSKFKWDDLEFQKYIGSRPTIW
jgi:hypothetical protein